MAALLLRAYAKVNYALEVLGRREDGYHEIRTIMQSVSLHDEVLIERAEEGFELRVEPAGARVGPPETNTAYLAWKALGGDLPVRVTLRKRIPSGSGLGGGSADAAAVLTGLSELFGLGLSAAELREVGATVGADVPFAVAGGTALAEGVGERLAALPAPPEHWLVIIMPGKGADTGEVYRLYDEWSGGRAPGSVGPVVASLEAGDLKALASSVGNDLTTVTAELVPEVREYGRRLLGAGALGAAMTGTGTAVFGVFEDERTARRAAGRMSAPFRCVCEPVSAGVEALAR
ncbi:MAG: 4-(cytidine 5'-diphospho)-2-C-methyl-D-erythritol kinase [Actinomycetota bacterium]